MNRFINPVPQFLKSNGDLCSSGKVYFYEEGSDVTLKSVYSDEDGTIALTNPVTLSDQGRISSVYGEGRYRVKLYDSDGVLQWSRDSDFSSESSQFDLWNSQKTYIINEIARGSDGFYYRSQTNDNKGNDPTNPSSSGEWSKIAIIEYFNADKVGGYANDEIVILNGRLYASNVAANTTTPPGASWDDLSFNNAVTGDFDVSGNTDTATLTLGNSASADPLKLDWYQEGTFTPTVYGATTAGSTTYSGRGGFYTRIGNVVFFTLYVDWSAQSGSGAMLVGGLPFTSASSLGNNSRVNVAYWNINVGSGNEITGLIGSNSSYIYIGYSEQAGGTGGGVTIEPAGALYITGQYFV